MEKLKDRYLMDKLFLLLLVLQPFIDMYRAFFQDTISIFGFAIEEIINFDTADSIEGLASFVGLRRLFCILFDLSGSAYAQ